MCHQLAHSAVLTYDLRDIPSQKCQLLKQARMVIYLLLSTVTMANPIASVCVAACSLALDLTVDTSIRDNEWLLLVNCVNLDPTTCMGLWCKCRTRAKKVASVVDCESASVFEQEEEDNPMPRLRMLLLFLRRQARLLQRLTTHSRISVPPMLEHVAWAVWHGYKL
jgi:hypothetical protein